jgi:hypothetical protein
MHSDAALPPLQIYRTLSGESSIRLVIILPSTSPEAAIQCRLESAVLGHCKPYEALSYVWGEPRFTESITLDGQNFMITPRLATALRHLRLPAEERTLWIDAICINQQDLAERHEQVGYMRSIYSSCSSNILWLGPGNEDRSQGMNAIRKLAVLISNSKRINGSWPIIDRSLKPQSGTRDVIEKLLYHDPVWKRVWIMQEISCSPKVILQSGHETLDWSIIETIGQYRGLYYADAFHSSFSHEANTTYRWGEMFGTAKHVMNQREATAKILQGGESTLLDVLARFKHTEATDPRDKIYALLGLVNDPIGVVVDYTKSVAETYAGVAIALINSSANLDILCQCPWELRHSNPDLPLLEGLPSWAPDFRNNQNGKFLFAQRGIYSAGRPNCSVPCVVERSTISLKGHCLGHLQASKGPTTSDLEEYQHNTHTFVRDYAYSNLITDESGKIIPHTHHTSEDQLQAFWRTLVADCKGYPQERLTSLDIARDYTAVRDLVDNPAESRNKFDITSPRMVYRLLYMEGWRFYTSDNGLFVLAQPSALAGDVIAILDGAKTPMVLRPTGKYADGNETYVPICGAYVHGFMNGEALKPRSGYVEKVFRLV